MFNTTDFKNMLKTDIWLINNMLTLPSDPPPKRIEKGNTVHIMVQDTYTMNDQIKAVKEYRNNLIPAIFAITQKVYAELFRLLISNNGIEAGWKQFDIEQQVKSISLNTFDPFEDRQEFEVWWDTKFNYKNLRKARNQIMHNNYYYDGQELTVNDESGNILIQWKAEEVIDFTQKLLQIVNRIN